VPGILAGSRPPTCSRQLEKRLSTMVSGRSSNRFGPFGGPTPRASPRRGPGSPRSAQLSAARLKSSLSRLRTGRSGSVQGARQAGRWSNRADGGPAASAGAPLDQHVTVGPGAVPEARSSASRGPTSGPRWPGGRLLRPRAHASQRFSDYDHRSAGCPGACPAFSQSRPRRIENDRVFAPGAGAGGLHAVQEIAWIGAEMPVAGRRSQQAAFRVDVPAPAHARGPSRQGWVPGPRKETRFATRRPHPARSRRALTQQSGWCRPGRGAVVGGVLVPPTPGPLPGGLQR